MARLQRGPDAKDGVRGPAIVTEFLSQGSLRSVLARKSDVISGALVRVLIAMDAAKASPLLGRGQPSAAFCCRCGVLRGDERAGNSTRQGMCLVSHSCEMATRRGASREC